MHGGQTLASFTKVGSTRARLSVREGELGCQATVEGKEGGKDSAEERKKGAGIADCASRRWDEPRLWSGRGRSELQEIFFPR